MICPVWVNTLVTIDSYTFTSKLNYSPNEVLSLPRASSFHVKENP